MSTFRLDRFVPRSRLAKACCGGSALFVIGGVFLLPAIIGAIVRAQLHSLVADQLNAELTFSRFDYDFPYTISVGDAKLVSHNADGQPETLLEVPKLDLTLARSPLSAGPLVIKELVIAEPSIHLIQTADGLLGEKSLVKTSSAPEPPRRKLSEIFELRRVSISNGSLVYENRTRRDVVPLVWRGLNLDLRTQPQAPAVYAYEVKAGTPPLATLTAKGDMNIDDLVLRVTGATLDATLRPDAPESPLPGDLQAALRDYAIDGRLRLTTSGTAPLRAIERSTFDGTLDLTDARGRIPAYGLDARRLALNVSFSTSVPGSGGLPPLNVNVKKLEAETVGGKLKLDRATLALSGMSWDVKDVTGSIVFAETRRNVVVRSRIAELLHDADPHGTLRFSASARGELGAAGPPHYDLVVEADAISFKLPNVAQPIDSLSGGIQLVDGAITLGPLSARYGPRAALRIAAARGRLTPTAWAIENVAGRMVFRDAGTVPNAADVIEQLSPRGDIDFTFDAGSETASMFNLTLMPRDVSLMVPGFGQRFEKLRGAVRIDRDAARIADLKATFGDDELTVTSATIPLAQAKGHIRIDDIAAAANFGPPPMQPYPPVVADILAALGPIGMYNVSGAVDIDRSTPNAKAVYGLRITTDVGALAPTTVKLPVIFPRATTIITQDAVNVSGIEVPVFGGKITGQFRMRLGERPTYEGNFEVKDIDLAEAKMVWDDPQKGPKEFRGKASGRVKVWGEIPKVNSSTLDGLRAEGMLRVVDGYFYDVPVLREISDWLHIERGSVIGEAVATFAIQDRTISLKRGVVSAPVLAAQGKGEIGFNGRLNLMITAASPRQRPNPGAGGVDAFVGGIIGAVNQGLATAGQWGLYEFEVTGNTDKPRIHVATPAINQAIDTVVGGIRDAAREANKK